MMDEEDEETNEPEPSPSADGVEAVPINGVVNGG